MTSRPGSGPAPGARAARATDVAGTQGAALIKGGGATPAAYADSGPTAAARGAQGDAHLAVVSPDVDTTPEVAPTPGDADRGVATADGGDNTGGLDESHARRPEVADAEPTRDSPPMGASAEGIRADGMPAAEAPEFTPLAGDNPVERHRLSHQAIWYWRWRAVFSLTPTLLLLCAFATVAPWGPQDLWWGIAAIYGIVLAVGIVVLPPIRQRVFWYALSPREIDIQHGIIFVKRTVVPIHRVQNLRTERGPVADHYWFTNLTIKTAAGSVTLSALDRVDADDLCNRISRLADVADDV